MSLLDGLIAQVARSAMSQGGNQQASTNQASANQGGGLGGMLGSVLGAATQSNNQQSNQSGGNGFGMDDVLGGLLGGGQQSAGSGALGSVLGSVLASQTGGKSAGGKGMLLAAVMPLVLSWIQKNGGLSGALSKITGMGLEGKAQSWVSADQPNSSLDPNDVNRLFDKQEIDQVAKQTGADESEVRQGIAELLPEVINQLTPKGGLEHEADANNEISDILSQLSGTLKNLG